MTDQPTTPDTSAKPAADATPAKPARRAPAKKAPVKKEFAPKVTNSGRMDHTDCEHERTMKGRTACRAAHKAATEAKKN